MNNEAIQGYKGFDENLKCRDYLFTVGCTFKQDGKIKACKNGFHFCENPLDVFCYYPPANSRYCAVEGNGELDKHDDKTACSVLKVKAEIGLPGLIKAGVEYIKSRVDWDSAKATNTGDASAATNTGYASAATNTGNRSAATNTGDASAATNTGDASAATNTGDASAATNTGDRSAATNTGYRSAAVNTGEQSVATNTGYLSDASVEGKESVAASLGIYGRAKAVKGSWLILAEWRKKEGEEWEWHRTDVQCHYVDDDKVKANTYYMLKNGVLTECGPEKC